MNGNTALLITSNASFMFYSKELNIDQMKAPV